MLGSLPVNLENPSEGSKINVGVRWILAKDAELTRPEKPAFSLEDFEAGVGFGESWLAERSLEQMARRRNDRGIACGFR